MADKSGKLYKTVTLDKRVWMAENMAWQDESVTCHANTEADADFIGNYGCLYTWEDAKKVCPAGWKLPSKDDFVHLVAFVGGDNSTGAQALRDASWNNGTGANGFAALPAGWFGNDIYLNFGQKAYFWSDTDLTQATSWSLSLDNSVVVNDYNMSLGYSVRCIQDKEPDCGAHGEWNESEHTCVCAGHFTGDGCDKCEEGWDIAKNCEETIPMNDAAGNSYKTTVINGRIWMAQNMAYQTEDITCLANTNADSDFVKNYGCLYTFEDAQKVCPDGWALPSRQELDALMTFVRANKTSDTDFLALAAKVPWKLNGSDNITITGGDDFGFAALPAGRYEDGNYNYFREMADFWTDTYWAGASDNTKVIILNLNSNNSTVAAGKAAFGVNNGAAVRCIKTPACGEHQKWDSAAQKCVCEGHFAGENCDECEDGWDIAQNCEKTSPMTDAAGNSYPTVDIGEQIWMAKNMAYQAEGITCSANTDEDSDFVANYGCLYTFADAQKVCPTGWHLPTRAEFEALLEYADANKTSASAFLALAGKVVFINELTDVPVMGKDDFGFGALPAGMYYADEDESFFDFFGTYALLWSGTTQDKVTDVLFVGDENVRLSRDFAPEGSYSVRCLKGAAPTE